MQHLASTALSAWLSAAPARAGPGGTVVGVDVKHACHTDGGSGNWVIVPWTDIHGWSAEQRGGGGGGGAFLHELDDAGGEREVAGAFHEARVVEAV